MDTVNPLRTAFSDIKGRVLVVDDNEDMRFLVREAVTNSFPHIQIIEANCGMRAAAELAKNFFNLVISDVEMEDGNGLWLHFFMQQFYAETPLLLFTSCPSEVPEPMRSRSIVSKANIKGLLVELPKAWSAP